MKKDSGFIEYNVVLILFFISIIITGIVLFSSSAIFFYRTDSRDYENKKAADLLLDEIIEKIQPLLHYHFDDKYNPLIMSLCAGYEIYNLQITDISSGYNLNFLSDEDMIDSDITSLLFLDNTGAAFTLWRNTNGLSVSKESWRNFLKQEAFDYCVSYGWLHKNDTSSFAFKTIVSSFGTGDIDKLFPLASDFPRMNVNMINPEILRPLIKRSSFTIEKPAEKADVLISTLNAGSLTRSGISSILDVPISHPIMNYFGTKTSFWKIYFIMPSSLEIEAVIAAIPKKNGEIQEIESYRLIERRFF